MSLIKKNPAKRRPTIAGPASAARGEKLWKSAFEGKTYKGYRIVFYDMQNLYGISAHGTHLSYAPTISAAEKIIDQLDPIDAHLKKNPAKRLQQGDNVRFSPAVVKRTGGFAGDMRGFIVSIHPSGKTASVDTHGTWQSEDGQSIRGIPLANLVHDSTRRANPAKRRKPAVKKKPPAVGRIIKQGVNGDRAYILRYDAHWQDNIVQFFINGVHQAKADGHFYDDRDDAIQTAENWLAQAERKTNPGKRRAKKYYIVEQEQNGLWQQIGKSASKELAFADAKLTAKLYPGHAIRVVHAYPAGHDHEPIK